MTRKVVVKQDDLLTPAEVQQNYTEVQQAMLKELRTWADLKCFSRKPKKDAQNIIDCRWVHKRKWAKPTTNAAACSEAVDRGKKIASGQDGHWTIRSRLTVRGFKDNQKDEIARYAGTSTRGGQKALVSEAVRHGWPICT